MVEFGVQLICSKAGNDLPQHRWKEICWGEPQTQWWSITRILHYALMCLNIDFECVRSLLSSVGAAGGGLWAVPVPVFSCHTGQGGFNDAVRNILTKKWASSPHPCSQQQTQA